MNEDNLESESNEEVKLEEVLPERVLAFLKDDEEEQVIVDKIFDDAIVSEDEKTVTEDLVEGVESELSKLKDAFITLESSVESLESQMSGVSEAIELIKNYGF